MYDMKSKIDCKPIVITTGITPIKIMAISVNCSHKSGYELAGYECSHGMVCNMKRTRSTYL